MRVLIAAAALLVAGLAQAQTTRVYSCPTNTRPAGQTGTVVGSSARDHVSCPSWGWTTPPPNRSADLPLVAVCTTSCGWNSGNTVTWKRPSALLDTDRVAICTGNVPSNPDFCSPQSFVAGVIPPAPTNPPPDPPPAPVDCLLSDWELPAGGAHPWNQCAGPNGITADPRTRSRLEIWTRRVIREPANGGAQCSGQLADPRTITQDCPSHPWVTSLTFNPNPVYTGVPVTVAWTTTGAVSCSASWSTQNDPTIALQGSKQLIATTPLRNFGVDIVCLNTIGESHTMHGGFWVRSKRPDCLPPNLEQFHQHVKWEPLKLSNWTTRYQAKAAWFCATPDGPRKQVMAFGLETAAANARRVLDGLLAAAAVLEQCEQDCEVFQPDNPIAVEMGPWAAPFTVEELGVIE